MMNAFIPHSFLLRLVLAAASVGGLHAEERAIPFPVADLAARGQAMPALVDVQGSLALVGHRAAGGLQATVFRRDGSGVWATDGVLATGAIEDLTLNPQVGNDAAVVIDGQVRFFITSGPGIWNPTVNQPVMPGSERAQRIVLEGQRMVVHTHTEELDFRARARIYQRTMGIWNQSGMIELPVIPGSLVFGTPRIQEVALSGSTVAVSGGSGQVVVHEQNAGGFGGWGRVASMDAASLGFAGFGESIALAGTRLVVAVRDGDGTLGVEVFGRDVGGANAWGPMGRLLDLPARYTFASVHTDGTRLMVVGYEANPGLAGETGMRAWWFGIGAGPGGWALEETREVATLPAVAGFITFQNTRRLAGLSGDEAIFGFSGNGYEGAAGWAAVFHRRLLGGGAGWGFAQRVAGPGGAAGFGAAMDFHGGLLAVGMPEDPWLGAGTGSVMLWWLITTGTGQGQVLLPLGRVESPLPLSGEKFGTAVAVQAGVGGGLNGAMLVVGAPGRNAGRGAAYVFDVTVAGILPRMLLVPGALTGPLQPGDAFGSALAIHRLGVGPSANALVAVGAPGDNNVGTDAGAAYLFERNLGGPDNWGQRAKRVRPGGIDGTRFGSRVALLSSGGGFFMFANRPPVPGSPGRIAAFARTQGGADGWGLHRVITAPPGAPPGFAASMHGNFITLGVGATGVPGTPGKAYLYLPSGDEWQPLLEAEGTASDGPSFGAAVAASFSNLAVGAPDAGIGGGRVSFYGMSVYGMSADFGIEAWSLLHTRGGVVGENLGRTVATWLIYAAAGAPSSDSHGTATGRVGIDRAGSYEIWAKSQGPDMLPDWLPWQDADGDGQPNLVEFALGSDPTDPASRGVFLPERSTFDPGTGPRPSMLWRRVAPPYFHQLLDWRVDASTDLARWNLAEFHPRYEGDVQLRHYLIPDPDPGRWFHRLAPSYPWVESEQGRIGGGGGPVLLD